MLSLCVYVAFTAVECKYRPRKNVNSGNTMRTKCQRVLFEYSCLCVVIGTDPNIAFISYVLSPFENKIILNIWRGILQQARAHEYAAEPLAKPCATNRQRSQTTRRISGEARTLIKCLSCCSEC